MHVMLFNELCGRTKPLGSGLVYFLLRRERYLRVRAK